MSNVTVKFRPPNLTSEVYALDQGIARAFEAHYLKRVLQIVAIAETSHRNSYLNKSISMLHTIQ
jgi:hypothetical protein